MKKWILIFIILLFSLPVWAGDYRKFGVHSFEACRAISNSGGNPAAVWAVLAKTKPKAIAYITAQPYEWWPDRGQFRQFLVYDEKVLNEFYQPTIPLLDLREDYEFLQMATVREQVWVSFLWSNLSFNEPDIPTELDIPGPEILYFDRLIQEEP